MSLDAFNREAGTRQGRIAPVGAAPLDGVEVFCLGFDGAQHTEQLNVGDYTSVSQTSLFDAGTKLFRISAVVRPPASVPTGLKWVLSLQVDAVVVSSITLVPGTRTRTRTMTANVSKVSHGTHTVSLTLQLQAA